MLVADLRRRAVQSDGDPAVSLAAARSRRAAGRRPPSRQGTQRSDWSGPGRWRRTRRRGCTEGRSAERWRELIDPSETGGSSHGEGRAAARSDAEQRRAARLAESLLGLAPAGLGARHQRVEPLDRAAARATGERAPAGRRSRRRPRASASRARRPGHPRAPATSRTCRAPPGPRASPRSRPARPAPRACGRAGRGTRARTSPPVAACRRSCACSICLPRLVVPAEGVQGHAAQLEVAGVRGLGEYALVVLACPQREDDAGPGMRVEPPGLAVRGERRLEQAAVAAGVDQRRRTVSASLRLRRARPSRRTIASRARPCSASWWAYTLCASGSSGSSSSARRKRLVGEREVLRRPLEVVLREQSVAAAELRPGGRERGVLRRRTGGRGPSRRRPATSRAPPRSRAGRTRRRGRSPACRAGASSSRPPSVGESDSTMRCASSSCSRNTSPSGDCSVCDDDDRAGRRLDQLGAGPDLLAGAQQGARQHEVDVGLGGDRVQVGRLAGEAGRGGARAQDQRRQAGERGRDRVGERERRKSISGSGRSRRNGSTTSRVSGRATDGTPAVGRQASPSRARGPAPRAEAGRSAGRLARARRSTRSSATTAESPVSAGGCS